MDVKRLAIVESSTKSTYRANIYYSVTNSSDNFIAYFEIDIFAYDGKGNLLGKCFLANGSNLKVGDTIKKDSPCFNIKASNIAKWDTQLKTVHVIQEKITYEVTDHFSVNLK
ncbi:MAG: hypothetical protein IPK68_04085 [Bdellovibrionales bacterium]|nr:hypothetical protein [Bdellovibrionales bacterium]